MEGYGPEPDGCHEKARDQVPSVQPDDPGGDDEGTGGDRVDGLAPPRLEDPFAVGGGGPDAQPLFFRSASEDAKAKDYARTGAALTGGMRPDELEGPFPGIRRLLGIVIVFAIEK